MQLHILISSLAWAATTLAAPTATTNGEGPASVPRRLHGTRTLPRRGTGAETVAAIMPLSTSCAGRGDECVTADVAAPYLASGFNHYGVTTAIEQAGILALVAYESVEMEYKRNTNETAAAGGQGTSNEQSGEFNLEFANSFDELKALGLTTSNVLDYVTKNTYNFWTVSTTDDEEAEEETVKMVQRLQKNRRLTC